MNLQNVVHLTGISKSKLNKAGICGKKSLQSHVLNSVCSCRLRRKLGLSGMFGLFCLQIVATKRKLNFLYLAELSIERFY